MSQLDSIKYKMTLSSLELDAIGRIIQAEEDEETILDIIAGCTSMIELVDAILLYIGEVQHEIESLIDIKKKVESKIGAAERKVEVLRGLLKTILGKTGLTKIKSNLGSVYYGAAPKKVIISEQEAIPERFFRIERKPDLSSIKTAIEGGEEVTGAEIVVGEKPLCIRGI